MEALRRYQSAESWPNFSHYGVTLAAGKSASSLISHSEGFPGKNKRALNGHEVKSISGLTTSTDSGLGPYNVELCCLGCLSSFLVLFKNVNCKFWK